MGKAKYEDAHSLFITADGGGSNGYRNRLWEKNYNGLRTSSDSISMFPISLQTSKWNKIAHRMFFAISMNWRGKPLVSLEVIGNWVTGATTKTGLKIEAFINRNEYKLGEKVHDKDLRN